MAGDNPIKLSQFGEDALIKTLLKGVPQGAATILGPGDDCAVLKGAKKGECLLLKTDCVVEGIHFLPSHDAARVGWKALCRAISDIAAMGGIPQSALITVFTPHDREVIYWKRFYRGLSKAARRYGVGIVGGETSRAAQVAVAVTLTGRVNRRHVITRSGGSPGDRLYVTGRLGGSISGHHLDFQPRVAEGGWLASRGFATAMMDLSDGLAADLPRLAKASDCSFSIDPDTLPRTRGATIEQALSDGEDYELLFAVNPRRCSALVAQWKKKFPLVPLTEIGALAARGIKALPLSGGFDHFFHCQQAGKRAS